MCSITDPRLAMIGMAIDELAEDARAAAARPGQPWARRTRWRSA